MCKREMTLKTPTCRKITKHKTKKENTHNYYLT